ncbi:Sec34-like family protein [Sodiomyces alkalinus F11]|uniref:Conserved oligomeric Golgi complex subunit 3 n=1 Tax=Sodiomyces alkalinus (strain CBS 110278 / VKM F-3762 / F11) TaxID=1314773 RepID=A0A3N2PMS6_SODAK|nr:Sec34-like family protein [Sodiomyces alkalinus F11]ROT35825.1 Sec34-like family protein [Sodiomyces alkalinus F11]
MYEDSWYSFVPEVTKKSTSSGQGTGHRRKESLLQQPNVSSNEAPPTLSKLVEEEARRSPPEATVARRAKSYSDFYHVVRSQLAKDSQKKKQKKREEDQRKRRKDRKTLEALNLAANVDDVVFPPKPILTQYDDRLLEASQQDYLLYKDQLALTERHLDSLIDDTNSALELLTTLSKSFQAVEAQTSSFKSQCEDLLSEKRRLQKLAGDVGTDLHFYAYLDNVTRRLNAPGASRLVDDDDFVEVLSNLDSCIAFMGRNTAYRDAESYLARYEALLTKALHLLEVGFTNRLDRISAEIAPSIASSKSEATRHALAYSRFGELVLTSDSLIPNMQKVVRSVYDELGRPVSGTAGEIYGNTARHLFQSYFSVRDRDLKAMTQRDVDEFKRELKELSMETASRNLVKQTFEKAFNETNLFARVFGIELQWSSDPESVYALLKSYQRSLANPTNLVPLANTLQATMQASSLPAICNVVAWLMNEYLALDYEDEESPFAKQCRELSARLLTEHLWVFTDNAFEAEVSKTISKAMVKDEELKIGPVVDGVSSSNAYPAVKKALELLVMYDQTMPKERSQTNSQVIFKIVRETINVLQRAESRLKSLKSSTDPDIFMVKNLLIIKNELLSLEIGDIRGEDGGYAGMQHFNRIWETLSPQNWASFFGNIIGGVGSSFWSSSSSPSTSSAAAGGGNKVTAKTLTVEDMNHQLDELLRQSIVGFTQRWGRLMNDAKARKAGVKPIGKVERQLEELLQKAFSNQPEVIAKLNEAIQMSAEAQAKAAGEKKGVRQY